MPPVTQTASLEVRTPPSDVRGSRRGRSGSPAGSSRTCAAPRGSSAANSSNRNSSNGSRSPGSIPSPARTRSTIESAASSIASDTSEGNSNYIAPLAIRLSPAVDASNLSFSINEPPTDRPVRIYCDGIFDLFHYGHARCLEQAKKAFASVHLIVGVCDDVVTHKHKGKTVMSDIERFESVRHCIWVDEVVEGAPWVLNQEFLDKYKIDYVAHDNIPYASSDCADVYDFVKKQGKFLPTRRTEGISTSDLITRIVRDYDQYLRRNLARGVSPKELNIGFFKQKQLAVERSVQEITDEIKSEFEEWKDDIKETFKNWERRSSHYVRGFVSLFRSGPGLVVKLLRMKPQREMRSTGKRRRTPLVTPVSQTHSGSDDNDEFSDASSSSIVTSSSSNEEVTQYHVRSPRNRRAQLNDAFSYSDDNDDSDASRDEDNQEEYQDALDDRQSGIKGIDGPSLSAAVRKLTRAPVIDTKSAKRSRRC